MHMAVHGVTGFHHKHFSAFTVSQSALTQTIEFMLRLCFPHCIRSKVKIFTYLLQNVYITTILISSLPLRVG